MGGLSLIFDFQKGEWGVGFSRQLGAATHEGLFSRTVPVPIPEFLSTPAQPIGGELRNSYVTPKREAVTAAAVIAREVVASYAFASRGSWTRYRNDRSVLWAAAATLKR